MEIAVSELIVKFMERLEVRHVFGVPGSHILPVYDALYDSSVKSVLVKHEQGAAFMACGQARVTGGVGACIATAGPGATNLVTGIANAYADRQPLLAITGEASTHVFGRGGLQESSGEGGSIDQAALFKGITRYHKIVERTDYLPQVLNQTAKILLSPNPGPVLLSFPYNVQKERIDAGVLDHVACARRAEVSGRRCMAVDGLADLIAGARYPVLIAGYGCVNSGAQEALARLSVSMGIPVATTLKGKGVLGEGAALSLGSLGVTSNGEAYRYIAEHADLLVFLGAGFNERTSYLWDDKLLMGKKIAQIDSDDGQLEKVFRANLAIHGDIRSALEVVLERLEHSGAEPKDLGAFRAHRAHGGSVRAESGIAAGARFALAAGFFARLEKHFPAGAQIFDDNIVFAQNFFKVSSGNRYYPNSGISSLGHAVPAAIGARFAEPLATFAILGDGGFQMCAMELMTAVNYGIPLNVVLFNNSTMGLIRKTQVQRYESRFIDRDFVNPDYRHLALAFGIAHRRVESEADLDGVFAELDLRNGINLIEIAMDKDAFPNYNSGR